MFIDPIMLLYPVYLILSFHLNSHMLLYTIHHMISAEVSNFGHEKIEFSWSLV